MLYNFTSRRIGVCVSSALSAYRKLVPVDRPRKDYLASTRVDETNTDAEMTGKEETDDFYAQIKRRKF